MADANATNPNVSSVSDHEPATAALSREHIERLFPGALEELGKYVASGKDVDRRGGLSTALTHAHDLCMVLTLINEDSLNKVEDDVFARLAWMAASFVESAANIADVKTEI